MDLSPGQRKAAFTVIVLALAALGAFLLMPGSHPAQATGAARAARSPAAPATGGPVGSGPAGSGPAATASPAAPAAQAGPTPSVDIYHLLPFSNDSLNQAVALAERFAAAYGTYSYRQSAASYVAAMRGLVTTQLASTLARGYATPGVAQTRTQQKQVSAGTAAVNALRAFGSSSLTFLVTIMQKITQVQGKSQLTSRYAVTVSKAGTGWRVSDIQLASAGNS